MFDSLILIIGLLLMFLAALGGWIAERVYRKATLKEIKKQIKSEMSWFEKRNKYETDEKLKTHNEGKIMGYKNVLNIFNTNIRRN